MILVSLSLYIVREAWSARHQMLPSLPTRPGETIVESSGKGSGIRNDSLVVLLGPLQMTGSIRMHRLIRITESAWDQRGIFLVT